MQATSTNKIKKELEEEHLEFIENQKGITYDKLFGDYIRGAKNIVIKDPYLRIFFQLRNLRVDKSIL